MALNFIKEAITIGADKITDKTFTFFKQGFRLNGAIGEPEYRDVTVSGVDSLTLPNAKADGLNYCKLYGKCEQRNLPEGYTQVEYLKATGAQLINTGISGNDDDLVIDIVCKYSAWVQYGAIFGNWVQDGYDATRIITAGTNNDKLVVNYNNLSGGGSTTVDAPKNTRLHIILKKGFITINGVTAEISSEKGTTNNNVIALFNRNVNNPANRNLQLEIESYFVTKNNVVIQNLIPCRRNSDNVLGMYDTVTGNFLTNAGTGTFTAGNDVIPTPTQPLNIICNNGVVKVSPNLLNLGTATNGYYYDSNGVLTNHDDARLSNYIPIKANITYTVTTKVVGEGNLYVRYNLFNSSETWLSQELSNISSSDGNFSKQITPTQDGYLRFSGNYQGIKYVDWQNAQVIKGSTPTTYMPYGQIYVDGTTETVKDSLNNTATAEMLLAVNDYKDEQEVLTGNVTRNFAIKVLDGSESWVYQAEYSRFNTAIGNMKPGVRDTAIACTHYQAITDGREITNVPNNSIYSITSATRICIKTDQFTSVASFTSFLQQQYANGTPVIVVYQLATPTTSTVTGQTLTTKKGTNTIEITQASLTGLPIEVNYMAGVSVTVQQIENANLDNQVTVTIGE